MAAGMGRLASRAMFERIARTKEANAAARRQAEIDRLNDPLEQAKSFIKRRGWHCFNESLMVPGSKLIVVGRTPRTPEEVIAFAERLKAGMA